MIPRRSVTRTPPLVLALNLCFDGECGLLRARHGFLVLCVHTLLLVWAEIGPVLADNCAQGAAGGSCSSLAVADSDAFV